MGGLSLDALKEKLEFADAMTQFCEDMGIGMSGDFAGVSVGVVTGTQLLTPAVLSQKPPQRDTLDPWKLYLDSCATYHCAFVEWLLKNVRVVDTILKGNCNAGVTTSNEKGTFGGQFDLWLNRNGIANLLSIPQLEEDGYVINYSTHGEWVVTTPQGKEIVFKRDTGLCNRMPYIDMREHQGAFAMVQTVRDKFEGYTKRQVEKAILARKAQALVGHPSDVEFKKMD